MAFRPHVRRRRAGAGRVAAALGLACFAGAGAALLAAGPAAAQLNAPAPCIPLVNCPTPTSSHSSTPTPTQSATAKPSQTSRPRSTAPPSSNYYPPPSFSAPAGTPLPTLPPPSPGAPPQPPDLQVQDITMALASDQPSHPGAEVLIEATLEAQRGTDTYAVPHATVTFSISAQPGAGAFVDPPQLDSGDTGVVVVTVQTGDQPGDTVVHAVAGSAAADYTVHSDPATPTPTAIPARHATTPVGASGGGNSQARRLLVASLAALLAAMGGATAAAVVLGRVSLSNPFQRRRAWGRRLR